MTRRRFRTSALSLLCLSFLMGNRFMTMASEPEEPTPLLLSVADPPAPFVGSDQRVHLVYELRITNFSSGQATIESVEVLGDGAVLKKMDAAEIATRLQPAGMRQAVGVLPKSTQALLFVHFTVPAGARAASQISHRVIARFAAAPPSHQELTETGRSVKIRLARLRKSRVGGCLCLLFLRINPSTLQQGR
jgi:hypothetical protein